MSDQVTKSGALERIARFKARTARLEALRGRFGKAFGAYQDRYGKDCFRDDNAFLDVLYGLATRHGLFAHLRKALERKVGHPVQDMESKYEDALLAHALHFAVSGDVKLDLHEYYWDETNVVERQLRDDEEPDFSTLEVVLTFLDGHVEERSFKNSEAASAVLVNSPRMEAVRRARKRYASLDAQQEKINAVLYQYSIAYGYNCFTSHSAFIGEIWILAKSKGLPTVLQAIVSQRLERKVENFEAQYEELLAAVTMGKVLESQVKLDIGQYAWDDRAHAQEQVRRDENPDFTKADAILRFLEEVRDSESLTPHRIKPLGPAPSSEPLPIPTIKTKTAFGPWIKESPIGAGGQGIVFRVRHERDQRVCALKWLRRTDKKALARFRQEAALQERLSPDVAIPIVEVRHDQRGENVRYIVMEFARHGSLFDQSSYTKGHLEHSLKLFRKILFLVRKCHESGVFHRDLKPGNILFPSDPNEPRLADFGISYVIGASQGVRHTGTSERIGSRGFMAPEQDLGRNADVDARADTFSLGKVLHWMLTGRTSEGDRLLPPEDYLREFGDPRYRTVHHWLAERIVVEDKDRRVATVDQALREYDELLTTLLSFVPGEPLPPPQVPQGEDPVRWAEAQSLIGRIPLQEVEVCRSISKLQGRQRNTDVGSVAADLRIPDDIVLRRLAESLKYNLVETIIPMVRKRNGSNQTLSLTELGRSFLKAVVPSHS